MNNFDSLYDKYVGVRQNEIQVLASEKNKNNKIAMILGVVLALTIFGGLGIISIVASPNIDGLNNLLRNLIVIIIVITVNIVVGIYYAKACKKQKNRPNKDVTNVDYVDIINNQIMPSLTKELFADEQIEMCHFSIHSANREQRGSGIVFVYSDVKYSISSTGVQITMQTSIKSNDDFYADIFPITVKNQNTINENNFDNNFAIHTNNNDLIKEFLEANIVNQLLNFKKKHNFKFNLIIKNNIVELIIPARYLFFEEPINKEDFRKSFELINDLSQLAKTIIKKGGFNNEKKRK